MRSGGLTSTAYPQGTVFLRKSAAQVEQEGYSRAADEIQSQLLAGMARVGNDKIPGDAGCRYPRLCHAVAQSSAWADCHCR